MVKDLAISKKYSGIGWRRGYPSFRGKHNRNRVMLYYVLHLYQQLYRTGRGLTGEELAQLTGLIPACVYTGLTKATSQDFILVHLEKGRNAHGHFRFYRYYRIAPLAEEWLTRYEKLIPWEKYNLEEKGQVETMLKIRALVVQRGFH
jgi:hypothetical protein